ncbi:MAG: hypothetical protein DDT38_01247 [Firmicutes bacterium]|nr:hypothetical protein [candidate division NPL-UPA2 bacterium]
MESDNLAGCDHSHTLKHVRYTATDHIHFADESREHATAAFYFYARLNDVLNRHNTRSLIGLGDVDVNRSQTLIPQSIDHLLLVNVQHIAVNFRLCTKTHVLDCDVAQFQTHASTP